MFMTTEKKGIYLKNNKLKPPAIAEIVFDILYLIFALTAGLYMLLNGAGNTPLTLFGILAITLGLGDAFHLLPRVYSLFTNTMDENYKALGVGKLITSITMTVFYVLLYEIWTRIYEMEPLVLLYAVILGLGAVRIILCLFPQNGWLSKEPSYRFAIYRNIPFVILGTIVAALFAITGLRNQGDGFALMSPAIILSFIFYLIVVLFAGKNKKLGMFMLPKTCTYVWMICMGFSLL